MKALKSLEPKQQNAFRNKYLAAIFAVAALLITSVVSAQTDSSKYSPINGYGFKYKRHVQDSISIVPLSSSPHTPYRPGGIRYNPGDSTLQIWTGYQWRSIITGSTGIDTAHMVNDTVLAIETPGENYLLQVSKRHVDSIYRKPGQDSIFFKIYGVERAIKDSSGTPLSNVGTGFRWVTTPNGSVKSAIFGYGLNGDSTATANTITVQADTSETNHLVTTSDLNDAIAGVVISPAGSDRQIQINDAGVFGVQSGVIVTSQGTIVSDSVQSLLHTFRGDSTIYKKLIFAKASRRDGATVGFIGFGETENQYETSTINNTLGFGLGTPEIGGTHSMYLQMENNWTPFEGALYRQKEYYLHIIYPTGLNMRPMSWTGSIEGDDGTWLWRGNLHSYTDWDGRHSLGGFSRGAGEITTYHNFSGTGSISLTVRDSTIATGNTVAAGMSIVGQIAGGLRTSTTNHYGQNIYNIFERGPIFRSTTGSGGDINGWNFMFNIPSANTNHPLIITKGDSYFDNVYFWIHNDGRTVSGDANNFFSGYKFQAKPFGSMKAFISGDFDASNNTVLYTASFGHQLTAGAGASGMGAGYDFVADNSANTLTSIADIAGVWSGTPTAGAENGDILGRTIRNGTLQQAFRSYSTGEFSIDVIDSVASPANMVWQHPNTKKLMKSAAPGGIASINSQTGPAITISNQGAIIVNNPSANTIGLAVDVTSDLLPRTIDAVITTAQNTGTSETDLYSKTIAALTLNTDKQTLNFEADGEFNDNTATAQLKLYFGGNVTLNTGAINISTANTAWRLKGYIIRTSSTTAHVTYELHAPGLATPVFVGYNNLTSLDFTSANILKVTAQAGGAGGGTADITAHSWQVLYKPAP